jgi:hypothetical protein
MAVQKMASWLRKQCSRFFGRVPGSTTASLTATRNVKKEVKEEEELWLAAFQKMDTSSDMHVEVSELREWFAASPLPAQMSFSDFLELMMAKDGDYDGKLSFHEWKTTMLHLKRMGELKSKLRDPLFALNCPWKCCRSRLNKQTKTSCGPPHFAFSTFFVFSAATWAASYSTCAYFGSVRVPTGQSLRLPSLVP